MMEQINDKDRMQKKNHYIELLRKNGFNCFPIPELNKAADYRYKAKRTEHNQKINDDENFGYIPIEGSKTAIIDFDDKIRFRPYAESKKIEWMLIETPHGYHLPIKNISGEISKIELFDYTVNDDKILEIQGPDHYCVGPYSLVYDDDKKKIGPIVGYENIGTEQIWDCQGLDFHNLVDMICKNLKVQARKKDSRSSYKNFRDRFKKRLPPTKGTSNDYFFQAAIQCKLDGLTKGEALDNIKTVYDKWTTTSDYSGRPWSNIETKVANAYELELHPEGGRRKEGIDTAVIAQNIIADRSIYSNVETHDIFENQSGFLERINDHLKRELVTANPTMKREEYNDILFKLESLAEPIPDTNKNLIVFKNGVFDRVQKKIIDTEELADLGFKNYNYLEPIEENKPVRFYQMLYGNVKESEHKRINTGLRSILSNRLDPRISVIYGRSGVGKSTPLNILVKILGDYALSVELDQILKDRFIRAKIRGKRLVVLEDLPEDWKDFAQIKTMTGEQIKTERGFMQDSTQFENKIKIWASGNYLAKIPEHEKNAMYTRRLSLIHNTKEEAYSENPGLIDEIVKEEGEKIISWILNLKDADCQYEDGFTVRLEWEAIASPEIEFLEKHFEISEVESSVTIVQVMRFFKEKTRQPIDLDLMKKTLESQGYVIRLNVIKNIQEKKTIELKPRENKIEGYTP